MDDTRIIKNAAVLDPQTGAAEKRTLYIAGGKYVNMLEDAGIPVFDAEGCYAAPGFVDSHVHVFEKTAAISIEADKIGVRQGVLTVVDAGSTGIRDFPCFERSVIKGSKTDVRFFLNIARSGLCGGLSELGNPDDLMTQEELYNFKQRHGDHMVGLKVRMSGSVVQGSGIKPLAYARELSDKSGLPLMIHIGNAPPKLDEVLNILKEGDIVTHCFHGKPGGMPDYPREFKAAALRGVRFDVGHGAASFSGATVPKVLDICPVDFSISTDLYSANYETPVGSLMDTMTKFLPMGYAAEDLVRRVTALPRSVLGMPAAGFDMGQAADITLFRMKEGTRLLADSEGRGIPVNRFFSPVASIKKGVQVWRSEF